MIQANCRAQFTREDFEFLLETLARRSGDLPSLQALLGDESALQQLLDHEAVLTAILSRTGCLRISPYLYFYVIARRVLLQAGIRDAAVADYVGSLLVEFSRASRLHTIPSRPGQQFEYLCDLLAVITRARDAEAFEVHAHIGNYTLFLTGVFPRHLEHRTRYKGAPGIRFYEGVGRQSFRVVSDHVLARKRQLDEVFQCLAEEFHEIRLALNDMADRLLALNKEDAEADGFLRGFQATA